MKKINHGALVAAAFFLAATVPTFGIEGLKIKVVCPDVVLSWPSADGETYIVQYRATLDPNDTWATLTNSLPATSGTNRTSFVHSNMVDCPSGQIFGMMSSGGSSSASSFSSFTSTSLTSADQEEVSEPTEPMVMPKDGSSLPTPLKLYPQGFDLSGWIIIWPDGSTTAWTQEIVETYTQVLAESSTSALSSQILVNGLDGPSGNGPLDGGAANNTGFYEVVKVGATLYGLTNGTTISNVVKLPVELGELSGQLTTVTLEDSGVPIATSTQVAPFGLSVPLLVLDTTQMSNGVHNISVHAFWTDPGDGTEDGSGAIYEDYSPVVSVTVSNEISFPNWIAGFGELGNSLVVSAQSAHTNAQWYLDVYDSQFSYIGTLGGTTPDGNIYVVWDLVGPDGTLHTDNTFEFVLTTVYDDPVTTSTVVPATYRVTDPWNGPGDWVVVYQEAWNHLNGSDLLNTNADIFAQGAQALGLTVRPTTSDGSAYHLRYYPDPNGDFDWANFRSALYNNLSRNLFYLGHGGPQGLGYDQTTTNRSILAKEIATVLATIPAGRTNVHKYRFVCLDGCSTASGTLPESQSEFVRVLLL